MPRSTSLPRVAWLALALTLGACGGGTSAQRPPGPSEGAAIPPASMAPVPPSAPEAPAEQLREAPAPTPAEQSEPVLMMRAGEGGEKQETWVPASQALAEGYTLVDLSDDWTPYLFEELHDPSGQPLLNRYRRVFVGLANDELDGDGEPLDPGEKNYLELYGIFPSLRVLRERFLKDETQTCADPEGAEALRAVKAVGFESEAEHRRNLYRQPRLGRELETARVRARVGSLDELGQKNATLAAKVKDFQRWDAETKAVAAAERRLICEGFLPAPEPGKPKRGKHEPGVQDGALQSALRRFQQKHMIYDGQSLRPRTVTTLAQTPLENDQASLIRALRERVVAAANVLEDGSSEGKNGPPTYLTKDGARVPLPNLAEEYTHAAAEQLGLDTPESALAFFKRHDAPAFKHLFAAVKLPPRPEYYAPHMELSIVIDRGDVWYDPPFDDKDKWHIQPRQHYPTLTLFMDYLGQHVPLVRWRTTIGGWRSDQASNGYEYYRYKGSDVGPRILRKIVSGPVWIAPESTPLRGMVKGRKVQNRWQTTVNYDELGPGYASAYGVVAGYFVIPGENGRPDVDRGIRAHGSSEYLSIYSPDGYSHGCHRLPNHLAIRLYDFLLQHRHTIIKGDAPMDFARQFLWKEQVYEMRIPSRGFEFELDPPMNVNVLEGNIMGELKEPVEGPVPKPGVEYPPEPLNEDEGAASKAGP